VLNDAGKSVIDSVLGEHPEFVFTRAGNRLTGMNNSGWKAARRRSAARYEEILRAPCPGGFRRIRVHDLKHTFGRRLRAACVSVEDRQDLLGHKSARTTTHYCAAEITTLIEAANRVCQEPSRKKSCTTITAQCRDAPKCRRNWWKGRESNPRLITQRSRSS
jgi:integrase